jgi:hypothetical protein
MSEDLRAYHVEKHVLTNRVNATVLPHYVLMFLSNMHMDRYENFDEFDTVLHYYFHNWNINAGWCYNRIMYLNDTKTFIYYKKLSKYGEAKLRLI